MRLSDNYRPSALGEFPDGDLSETISGKNLVGEPTTAYVYRPDTSKSFSGLFPDGDEFIGLEVSDSDPGEVVATIQFIVPNPDGPKGEMPLEFSEAGLAALRKILAR